MCARSILGLILLLATACGDGGGGGTTPGPDTSEPGLDTTAEDTTIVPDTTVEPEIFVPPEDCDDPSDCDDGDPCTTDLCTAGECVYQDATGVCDDGDPCTVADQCAAGTCAGTLMDCDDGDDCTEDSCKAGACDNDLLKTPECVITVTIQSPPRGATLWEDKVVHVTGTIAAQGHEITQATLNGHPFTVNGNGSFDAVTEAVVGMNLVKINIEDALGRKGRGLRAYLYGEGIQPPGSPADVKHFVAGSMAWLDQEVLDDDDTSDLDDLATLAWTVLSSYDLNQFIPHPLLHEDEGPGIAWCTWEVDIDNVEYTVGPLDLDAVDGGLALSATLTDLSADVSAVAGGACPDAIGYLYADLVSIDAVFTVALNEVGAFDLDLVSVSVTIEGVSVDIVEGLGSYFDWLVNWFDGTISSLIEENLETYLPDSLIPMLDELLTTFTSYDMEIPIPAIPGTAAGTPLTLSVWPSAVDFVYGGVFVDLDIGVAAQKLIGHLSPGSILRGDCEGKDPGTFSLPAQNAVEAALAEDLVNQLLFALWWGGHMNVTLTNEVLGPVVEQFGITALVVQVDPYLPPVITTCAAENGVEVQIGALNLWASVDMEGETGELELFGHLRVEAEPFLTIGPDGLNHVGIKVVAVEELATEVISSEGVVDGMDGLVEGLLKVAIVDFIIGDYLSQLLASYPIPAVDLGNFIPGVPSGSEVTFDFQTLDPVYGYWLGGGSVVNP
ncbi:MAG: hypothetical protein ABIK09_14640 [Pseudomonadota bacterium]